MGWSRFFRRSHWDAERARELEAYLAEEIDDNIARGMSPPDAAAAAHRKLGNTTLIREDIFEMNTMRLVEAFWQDLRYGMRILLKNPTFSIVAILTLALGTGANAAIFQLVNSLRLRPLPVERPHELVAVGIDTHDTGRTGRFMSRRARFTEPQWRALEAEQRVFSDILGWGISGWNLATDGAYQPAQGIYVSGSFFKTLGVNAHVGRVLSAADDRAGCGAPGAVLAYGFWQSRYGGNPAAVGQTITLDNRPFEIVGVTPASFFGVEVGRTFDVALPLCSEPIFRGEQSALGRRDTWFLDIMGRLAPGVTMQQAEAQLQAMSPALFQATLPERYNAETARNYLAFTFTAEPAGTGVSGLRAAYETQLWILLGATALVLLITCANLANLMLARATAREREIAVRLAIGASRQRLVRQMLSESLLIAAFGALGGAMLSGWLSQSLVSFISTDSSRLFLDLAPDWRVFGFIAGLAVAACLLFGLSPALRATGADPGKAMQAGGRSSTDSHERFALRRGLVVVQVALSLVLIIGAMLFGRSLRNLVHVDPGFRTDGIVAVNVDLRRVAIDPEARMQTYTQIMDRVRTVPGVMQAAEAFIAPMSGSGWNQNVIVDGQERDGNVNLNRVGPDYFTAMDTRLIAGRMFGPDDRPGSTPTAIVNESFAREYFGGANPVGRSFQLVMNAGEPQPHFQVVGLVEDTKYNDLREAFGPIGYFPAAHETRVGPYLDLIVRSDMTLSSLTPSLTRTIREITPGATVSYDLMSTYVRDSLVTERLMASLSLSLGGLAMLIATIGLYGVMSYMVSRRRVEIGIRMALGAEPRTVVRMVLGESGVLLGAGVVVGIGLAIAVSRYASSLLFGLEPWDPASIAMAVVSLGLVTLVAAWIPARRASRLAPTIALRAD
jgi:predicted permease